MVKNISLVPGIVLVIGCFIFAGCKFRIKRTTTQEVPLGASSEHHYYRDVFGNIHFSVGDFINNSPDSVEAELWQLVNLDTSVALMGRFLNGMPIKEWQFGLKGGRLFTTNWNIYNDNITGCSFSLPFDYEKTIIDSTCFKLTTKNDSLGKVSIVLNVSKSAPKNENQFKTEIERGLRQMGFTFSLKRNEIKNSKASYVFTEFFMKDSLNNDVKLYHIYGNLPSRIRFAEFSLYHEGPKEELIKPIFNLVVNHLYIGEERFYNPYLR